MCEVTIKKILFDITQNGQPKATIWVDEDDISVVSNGKQINLLEQVQYLFFKEEGDVVDLKRNGTWWNIIVPASFSETYSKNKGLQKAFNNSVKSIKAIRDGGQTTVSEEEQKDMFSNFMDDNLPLFEVAIDKLSSSKNKAIKAIMKNIEGTAKDQIAILELVFKFIGAFMPKFNQTYKVDRKESAQ